MRNNKLSDEKISLSRIALHVLDLPQRMSFTSGIGVRKSRQTLIVKWIDQNGCIGYGECSCRPDPYYSAEFLEGVVILIQKFVIPFLKKEQTYGELLHILKHIRGWNFAKSAVEAAAFQIVLQTSDYKLSDEIKAEPIAKIPAGISLGIYEDKLELYDVVQEAIAKGYQRLKFKVAPFVNIDVFNYISPLLFENNIHTGFDANGSFGRQDLEKLRYFVDTFQTIIEQPLPPNRFDVFLEAKKQIPALRVCADEEVKSIGDLIKLHSLNAIAELNLKIGRVGGIADSIEILNYCYDNDISCWIGGMFESGIGRLLNLKFASFLPQARAHDISPSARYFMEDIIVPEVTMEQGFIDVEQMQACKVMPSVMKKYTVATNTYDF